MSELIDNRANRIRTLKEIIKGLHTGVAPDQVKAQLAALVKETDAGEIAAMEQQLIDEEGFRVEEVRSMCDLHAAVLRDVQQERVSLETAPGHPVDTFRRENEALRSHTAALRGVLAELAALVPGASAEQPLHKARVLLGELMDIEKHYQRKENLLFSCLERHGVTGPSKVMWAKDDEVRALLKGLVQALAAPGLDGPQLSRIAVTQAEPALAAVEGMIEKEERILLPMSMQTLTEEEWGEVWRQSPEYGWCLVEPRTGYAPPAPTGPGETLQVPQGRAMVFPTGNLTFEQLLGLFSTLPVDLTFVDAEDRVRFFSEGPERVFPRSKAVIGRKVQHCHPPKSVDVVDRILSDFRAGRQSVAEFWITMRGKFIHIRYFAVRDEGGHYIGTLEVTQDLTRLRTLQGERRLLEYDSPTTA